jgi:hypothetical protein
MRALLMVPLLVLAGSAAAAPIQKGLTVTEFFSRLEKEAKELAEGGMDLNRVHCSDDGTVCGAYYGSANTVTAKAPAKGADMESVTIQQMEQGESQDFWLTTALVMDILDGDFKTIPERSDMILNAMRSPPGTAFNGNVGHYTFGRSNEGLSQAIVTAK